MTGFLYYTSDEVRTLEQVAGLGLAYAFEGGPVSRGTTGGPDGKPGYVFAPSDEGIGYYPDAQEWEQLSENVWVGMYTDARRPTPEDLARKQQISGHHVQFEDGSQWLVPCARRYVGNGDAAGIPWQGNLPTRFSYVDGQWRQDGVKLRYQDLWNLSAEYMDALIAAAADAEEIAEGETESVALEFQNVTHLAIVALQTNYRVSDLEVSMLGAFDAESCSAVIDAVCDMPTWRDWLKKNAGESAGVNS